MIIGKQTGNVDQTTIVVTMGSARKRCAVKGRRIRIRTTVPMVTRKLTRIAGMTMTAAMVGCAKTEDVASRKEVKWPISKGAQMRYILQKTDRFNELSSR